MADAVDVPEFCGAGSPAASLLNETGMPHLRSKFAALSVEAFDEMIQADKSKNMVRALE